MRVFCTYFDRNYLVRALALVQSLRQHAGAFRLYAVCHDELSRTILSTLDLPEVVPVPMHALEAHDPALLATKADRTAVEYYWTCTPTIILRLLERHPELDTLTYLDSDLYFFSSPEPLFDELAGHAALIHEHRFMPRLAHLEAESGRFNVGLLIFRNNDAAHAILRSWRAQCLDWCYYRAEDGKMGDQGYLTDWPDRFPEVGIIQHPGAGIAPWNHEAYRFAIRPDAQLCVNGVPLLFYHFHALTLLHPQIVLPAKHAVYRLSEDVLRRCYAPYLDALTAATATVQRILPSFTFGVDPSAPVPTATALVGGREHVPALQAKLPTYRPVALSDRWTALLPPLPDPPSATSSPDLDTSAASPSRFQGDGASDAPSSPPRLTKVALPETLDPDLPPSEDGLLRWLHRRPITNGIRTAFVVGAYLFQEHRLLDTLFPNLERIVLIEPLPPVADFLRESTKDDARIQVIPVALGGYNGSASFHVTDNRGASSSLLPLGAHKDVFPHVDVSGTIPVEVRTLDQLLAEHDLPAPDLLLLDVQGAEHAILASLSPPLRDAIQLIYTEASTEALYLGARPLSDLQTLLHPSFQSVSFLPLAPHTPMHGNALFVRTDLTTMIADMTRTPAVSEREARPPAAGGPYRVSALVSTYNAEAFIQGCLDDLVSQTLFARGELEIIVVDACSEEQEQAVVEAFQEQYGHIVYVRPARREPLYASWNRAIRLAQGRYVTNANTDDRHRPDALERLADHLDEHPEVALAYADSLITTEPHETFMDTSARFRFAWPAYSYEELERRCFVGPHPMWRRSLHDRYGYFREDLVSAADYEFWLRIGKTESFARYPDVLGLYYHNTEGLQYGDPVSVRETQQILDEYGITARGVERVSTPRLSVSPEERARFQAMAHSASPGTMALLDVVRAFAQQAEAGDWAAAERIVRQGLEHLPEASYLWVLLAMSLRLQNQMEAAVQAILRSFEIEETPDALYELLNISLATDNLDEAHETAAELKTRFPEWTERVLGTLQEDAGQPPYAEATVS